MGPAVSLELLPESDGGWLLQSPRGGLERTRYDTRAEAEAAAAAFLARNGGTGELLVFDGDGRVQEAKRWSSHGPEGG
jgi:hypothetical protein